MPWSRPVPRMREFVTAVREIWSCWQNGSKLRFEGDFYTHRLMTPMFTPSRSRTDCLKCSSPPSETR